MRTLFSILFLCIIFSAGLAQPMSKLAGFPGAPFRMGFGAQGIGFGNAQTAVRSRNIVGYYNPSLTPFQSSPTALVSVAILSLDRSLNHLSYTTPLPPQAGLSLSIINSGTSEIDGRDRDGQHIQTYSTSENVFMLSFGLRIRPELAIGISAKIFYYKLFEGITSTTAGFDFGGTYLISDEWTIGAAIQDVGSKYKWDTSPLYGLSGNSTTELFPVRKKVGLSYAPSDLNLTATIELEHTAEMSFLRAGAGYTLVDPFSLRAGIDQVGLSGNVLPKPTFGFTAKTGIGTWMSFLTYTYVIEPYAPTGIHFLELSVEF